MSLISYTYQQPPGYLPHLLQEAVAMQCDHRESRPVTARGAIRLGGVDRVWITKQPRFNPEQ